MECCICGEALDDDLVPNLGAIMSSDETKQSQGYKQADYWIHEMDMQLSDKICEDCFWK